MIKFAVNLITFIVRNKNLKDALSNKPPDRTGEIPVCERGITFKDMTYQEQLKSPKWQKKRLEILERDEYTCQNCGETENELHVHHLFYLRNLKIYEYPDKFYITLCKDCHEKIHDETEMLYKEIVNHLHEISVNYIESYLKALKVSIHINDYYIVAFNSVSDLYNGEDLSI